MRENSRLRRISFTTNEFVAIICLNGDIPERDFFNHFRDTPILAADGSAIKLKHCGIEPSKIIGDLDSFYESSEAQDFSVGKIIHIPDQESNDFEKILNYCLNAELNNILVIGFHGGDLEHTLNNWSVLARYAKLLNLCVYDETRYCIPMQQGFSITLKKDEIISLVPQPRARVNTSGLKWELDNEVLELGMREGARNKVVHERVSVDISEGELMLFIDARLPNSPRYESVI